MKTKQLIFSVNLSLNIAELFEKLEYLSIDELKGARIQITNEDSDDEHVTPIIITSESTMVVLPEDPSSCFVLEIIAPGEVVHLEHYDRADIIYDDALALAKWVEDINNLPAMPFSDYVVFDEKISGFSCRNSQIDELTQALNFDLMFDFEYNRSQVFKGGDILEKIEYHELDVKNGDREENFFETADVGRYVKWLVLNRKPEHRLFFEVA